MKLNEIKNNPGAHKRKDKLGRGSSSGLGKTSGRGVKGAKARTGNQVHGFEGGQMPLHMRMPKRGFRNIFAKDFSEVNLGRLQKAIDDKRLDGSAKITEEVLRKAGLAHKSRDGIRLLGKGEIKAKLDFTVAGASKSAVAAVEKAGGTVTIPTIVPANEKHAAKHRVAQKARAADKDAKKAAAKA